MNTQPDCGSSSCIFSPKGGMRTNGPCRCYENAGFHGSAVMSARQMLREVLLLRARLDAMPQDRTWTKDKPTTPGKWRVSIAPEKRTQDAFAYMFDGPVSRCKVASYELEQGKRQLHVSIMDNSEFRCLYPLSDPWFDGALWMRNEDPEDPFLDIERKAP